VKRQRNLPMSLYIDLISRIKWWSVGVSMPVEETAGLDIHIMPEVELTPERRQTERLTFIQGWNKLWLSPVSTVSFIFFGIFHNFFQWLLSFCEVCNVNA
jgi:hypothetical protein